MALWDRVKMMMAVQPTYDDVRPLQTRAIDSFTSMPGLSEQLLAVQGLTARPWRYPGLSEALGVPAVFRAVSLIANTTGMLSLDAFRRGEKLVDTARPRIVVRPDPFRTPRDFYRDTAYAMATRGEAWWWVAARDVDDVAMSLINVNPAEITMEEDSNDLRYPVIKWRNKVMPNRDMVQLTLLRDPTGFRGLGPLQVCGAAISVAVESQEWAANFFIEDGGHPSILIKSAMTLQEGEADALRNQWMGKPHNTPRVVDQSVEDVEEFGQNTQGAQMLQAREYSTGDVCRMFGIPGSMLDHTSAGSNLTYQNLETEFAKFVRGCLWPNYLEPIEQALSDLLVRSTVARFNVDALQRADIKTRYESYKLGVEAGVLTPELAQEMEGISPGNIENAPMPMAQPAAVPASLPIQIRSAEVRCDGRRLLKGIVRPCNLKLAEVGPFIGTCRRCGKEHSAVA